MNFLYPPFDNSRSAASLHGHQPEGRARRAGRQSQILKVCGALFGCGRRWIPMSVPTLVKGNGMAEAKKLLAESGYDGTPVVIMAPTDVVTLKAQPIVAAQLLREAGFKVDVQATDWQTVVTRRASQKPPKEGGWNMFFTNWAGRTCPTPLPTSRQRQGQERRLVRLARRRQDRGAARRVCAPSSPDEQKKIAAEIQTQAYDQVIYFLSGNISRRRLAESLTGVLDGPATPVFWNIDKK